MTFRCGYVRAAEQCEREAMDGWTACARHYTSGMQRSIWQRINAANAEPIAAIFPASAALAKVAERVRRP